MNKKIIDFLRDAMPFALALFLWRSALPFVNPAGILALVPVFFCTFIRPVPWFVPFGILMCFLVDYRGNSLLFWTSVYCLCCAAYGFQTVVDLTHADDDGFRAFALFFGVATLVISVPHFVNFTNIFRTIWTIGWECAMYIPIVALMKRLDHD